MNARLVWHLVLLALLVGLAFLLASCGAPQARPAPPATVDSTAAKRDSLAVLAPARRHRARRATDLAAVEPIAPAHVEDMAAGASPACLQLIAANERLRLARDRYARAMARFQARTEARQQRASDEDDPPTVTTEGYPADAYREFLAASMAVRALHGLCPDAD